MTRELKSSACDRQPSHRLSAIEWIGERPIFGGSLRFIIIFLLKIVFIERNCLCHWASFLPDRRRAILNGTSASPETTNISYNIMVISSLQFIRIHHNYHRHIMCVCPPLPPPPFPIIIIICIIFPSPDGVGVYLAASSRQTEGEEEPKCAQFQNKGVLHIKISNGGHPVVYDARYDAHIYKYVICIPNIGDDIFLLFWAQGPDCSAGQQTYTHTSIS